MRDVPLPRAGPLLTTSLGDDDLDPAVRALAVERLEALLLTAVRAVPGAAGVELVTVSVTEGTVAVSPAPTLDDAGSLLLRERVDRTLLAQLAATVGAARLAVRNGERARPRAPEAPPPPARWEDVVAALVGVVTAQHRALAALTGSSASEATEQELQRIAAMVERLRAG